MLPSSCPTCPASDPTCLASCATSNVQASSRQQPQKQTSQPKIQGQSLSTAQIHGQAAQPARLGNRFSAFQRLGEDWEGQPQEPAPREKPSPLRWRVSECTSLRSLPSTCLRCFGTHVTLISVEAFKRGGFGFGTLGCVDSVRLGACRYNTVLYERVQPRVCGNCHSASAEKLQVGRGGAGLAGATNLGSQLFKRSESVLDDEGRDELGPLCSQVDGHRSPEGLAKQYYLRPRQEPPRSRR